MNWQTLGLKSGIEIHQQLEGKKLFCNCPTKLREEEPDNRTVRRMRMAAGEMGEVDVAAAAEIAKGKYFIYETHKDTNCLVELDETPPHPLNKKALKVALQMCKATGAEVPDAVQVMRKTIVDGSNTSGFQRTALIGRNGILDVDGKKITIPTIIVEEDAARTIAQDEHSTTYRLDRLGIPLIEMSTGPDMHTPEDVGKVAKAIGMLLRSTGKAKRGLGTIRQDLNISITGGTRVEIKGAQDLGLIPKYVENEAIRQMELIKISEELKKKEPKLDDPIIDVTEQLEESESKLVQGALKHGASILGVRLPGFHGMLGKEIQPGRRLGTELSDAAKVAAGVKGLVHSDELPAYGITIEEKGVLQTALDCGGGDAYILVAAQKQQAAKALDAAIRRAKQAIQGVPKEVRKANPDGTTSFLRPMPGAARMYPETDIPLIKIEDPRLRNIEIPESIPDKIRKYQTGTYNLGKDLAESIATSENPDLFEELARRYPSIKPAYIAETLVGMPKTIKRDYNVEVSPTEKDWKTLFEALDKGEISKESIIDILKENKPTEEVLDRYKTLPQEEVDKILQKIIEENPGKQMNVLMGEAMKKLRGKAPGKMISERLKALIT